MEDIKELLHKIRRFIDEDEILKKYLIRLACSQKDVPLYCE